MTTLRPILFAFATLSFIIRRSWCLHVLWINPLVSYLSQLSCAPSCDLRLTHVIYIFS